MLLLKILLIISINNTFVFILFQYVCFEYQTRSRFSMQVLVSVNVIA